MKRNQPQGNSALIPSNATLCEIATDKKAAKALDNAKGKYAHVLPENIWRAPDGKHLMVLIRCTHPGCEAQRPIFTSDCFQVSTCIDHKKGKASAAPAVEVTEKAGKRVRSKDATKGGRKAPKAGKGNGKARKPRRIRTREDFIAAATGKGE